MADDQKKIIGHLTTAMIGKAAGILGAIILLGLQAFIAREEAAINSDTTSIVQSLTKIYQLLNTPKKE